MAEVQVTQEFLRELADALTSVDNRVTIKGATLLSLIVSVRGIHEYRTTEDIDLDYGGTLEDFKSTIRKAVSLTSKRDVSYHITEKINKIGSCSIVLETSDSVVFAKMDIQFRDNIKPYLYDLDGYKIKGQDITVILGDKITVASNDRGLLPRRIKDLYDLYHLSFLQSYKFSDISKSIEGKNKQDLYGVLGDFSKLTDYEDDTKKGIQYAYSKLSLNHTKEDYEIPKPLFIDVVKRVLLLCQPFIDKNTKELVWNTEGRWE